ncbi:MAG: hypothetical protein HUJ63_06860, partial [Enterococcus sp.]|nr:hypothetical protein [Enterococcus sp.]
SEFAQRKSVIDRICRQCFLRALRLMVLPDFARVDYPEIGDFLMRCAMRNVTLEQIVMVPQYFTIVACRDLALGADGKVAELDAFYQQYAGEMDEAGRRAVARKRAVLRFGTKDADDVIPHLSRDQSPSDQSSFATLENNMMKQGMEAQVGGDQWHWSHIPVHAQVLQQIVEMVAAPEDNTPEMNEFNGSVEESQQIGERVLGNLRDDPKRVLGILVMVSQHVQAHLAIGAKQMGMAGRAKQVAAMIRDLRPTIKALNLAVATQERVQEAERERQQREMAELERKASEAEVAKANYKADREAEVARYRVDRDHEVQMHRLDLERGRAARQADMAEASSARDQDRRDAEAAQRMRAAEEMSKAKVNAANAVARMNAVQDASGFGTVPPSAVSTMGPVDFGGM